jgi:heme oxygenase (biliverdin-IX-beta and delta-forming)
MSDSATPPTFEHDVPGPVPVLPPPLRDTPPAPRRTPAEEARALVASTNVATLATHSSDGYPWASLVAYGSLGDGSPVLFVSRLAEHARNLESDGRASLVVADPSPRKEVLASGRVTLAGTAERPSEELAETARDAYVAAVPSAKAYLDFRDFSLWILRVERVRWVGGYGRMDSVDAESYTAAEPDPVARAAAGAMAHLNVDHADALLAMAQALGGYPDATVATCTSIDRYGLDLELDTPRGPAATRIGFAERVTAADGLRAATVQLARHARGG